MRNGGVETKKNSMKVNQSQHTISPSTNHHEHSEIRGVGSHSEDGGLEVLFVARQIYEGDHLVTWCGGCHGDLCSGCHGKMWWCHVNWWMLLMIKMRRVRIKWKKQSQKKENGRSQMAD